MLRISVVLRAFLAVVVVFAALPCAQGARGGGRRAPAGFEVLDSYELSENQRAAISRTLGVQLLGFSHTSFSVNGRPLEMNIITCKDSEEAAVVQRTIVPKKKHPAFCITSDRMVIEFMGDHTDLAILAGFELGFRRRPEKASYKISFRMAPVEEADYTSWKTLSNLFALAALDRENTAVGTRIAMLARKYQFGNKIILRVLGSTEAGGASYSFEPKEGEATPLAGGDLGKYTFRDLPKDFNVPYVSMSATIHSATSEAVPTTRKADDALLGPTGYWPSDDPEVVSLAAEITAGHTGVKEKTGAILRWLKPGENIRFAESKSVARHGVKKVLRQKFGQAWDFSDCFVTLARASKIPCRQVSGWFFSQKAHVWAEVLDEGSGWRQVETTGGGVTGCGIYHIPFTTSEDGAMFFMYLSKPKIEFISD